jgi:hypothetical protein
MNIPAKLAVPLVAFLLCGVGIVAYYTSVRRENEVLAEADKRRQQQVLDEAEQAAAAAASLNPPTKDPNPALIKEWEAQRFGTLDPQDVITQCNVWISENEFEFGNPISRESSLSTTLDHKQSVYKYTLEALDSYLSCTQDRIEVRDMVREFFTGFASHLAGLEGCPTNVDIRKQLATIVAAGSTDPYIIALDGIMEQSTRSVGPKVQFAAELLLALKPMGYPPAIRVFLLRNTAPIDVRATGEPFSDALMEDVIQMLIEASGQPGTFRRCVEETQYVFEHFGNRPGLHELYRRCLEIDDLDPYLRHMIAGFYHVREAWFARGKGFANGISGERWKRFHDESRVAVPHLRMAWLLRPDIPLAAAHMASLAHSTGLDEWSGRQWFELASFAEYGRVETFRVHLNYLQPRWGGSFDQLREFGLECASTSDFDTFVPSIYFECISAYESDFLLTGEIDTASDPWRDARVVADVAAFWKSLSLWQESHEKQSRDWSSVRSAYSWTSAAMLRNRMYKEAYEVIRTHDRLPDAEQMELLTADPEMAIFTSFAIAGPNGEPLIKIEQRFEKDSFLSASASVVNDAFEAMETARDTSTHEIAAPYFASRCGVLKALKAFRSPDGGPLEFTDPLTSWSSMNGTFSVMTATQTVLSNTSAGRRSLQLRHSASFELPFTLEATLERIEGEYQQQYVGIELGETDTRDPTAQENAVFFMFDADNKKAGILFGNEDFRTVQSSSVPNSTNTARIKLVVGHDTVQMFVDEVAVPLELPDGFVCTNQFAIGGSVWLPIMGDIGVSDVQIRFDGLNTRAEAQ